MMLSPSPYPPLSCHVVPGEWPDQVTIKTQEKCYTLILDLYFSASKLFNKTTLTAITPSDNHTEYILGRGGCGHWYNPSASQLQTGVRAGEGCSVNSHRPHKGTGGLAALCHLP